MPETLSQIVFNLSCFTTAYNTHSHYQALMTVHHKSKTRFKTKVNIKFQKWLNSAEQVKCSPWHCVFPLRTSRTVTALWVCHLSPTTNISNQCRLCNIQHENGHSLLFLDIIKHTVTQKSIWTLKTHKMYESHYTVTEYKISSHVESANKWRKTFSQN